MSIRVKVFETPFASYTAQAVIGRGGSGRVLEVVDEHGSVFALKHLSPEHVSQEKVKRFRNELAFCQRDLHPGIVRVLDFGFVTMKGSKVPFYVMAKYPKTLRHHIAAGLPPSSALEMFSRILDAVEAAHLVDVWHRDLKPENILCGDDLQSLVLADFGIAHFAQDLLETSVATRAGARMANFAYAAPEQRQHGAQVDHRADIYALGLILNEMFTQQPPLGKDHRTIAQFAPDFAFLDPLVDLMLRQAPEGRPSSIAQVKSALIGHQLEFVSLQRLDEAQRRVVPSSTPLSVPDISIVARDYQDGRLLLTLDPMPLPVWMPLFQAPRSHSALVGYGPENYSLRDNVLSIQVPENLVEVVYRHTLEYMQSATTALRVEMAERAALQVRRQREKLAREVEEAETRERVLRRLSNL